MGELRVKLSQVVSHVPGIPKPPSCEGSIPQGRTLKTAIVPVADFTLLYSC